MQVQSYLFFDGRCEEAIEFYKKTLGAEVGMLMRLKDSPDNPSARPATRTSHARVLKIGDTAVMASDGAQGKPEFKGFSLSLNAKTRPRPSACSRACPTAGRCTMPLIKTFFSPSFGMVADKFGVAGW